MHSTLEQDDIIQVEDQVETGYFYLNDRQFRGPYPDNKQALKALQANCKSQAPGECRAIYHGTVKFNPATNTKEPLSDMKQVDVVTLVEATPA